MSSSFKVLSFISDCLLWFARFAFPSIARKEIGVFSKKKEKAVQTLDDDDIKIFDCFVCLNGTVNSWSLQDHDEYEHVAVMCECGYVSQPITLFKNYGTYRKAREAVPYDEVSDFILRSVVLTHQNKLRAYCPYCCKTIVAELEIKSLKAA